MKLAVVATGSSANCYVLHGTRHALILDAGVPMPRLLPYIKDAFDDVQGVLITHEHNDHARGALELAKRGLPTYCSNGCKSELVKRAGRDAYLLSLRTVSANSVYKMGDFTVMPFPVEHDANEPLGYLIRHEPTNELTVYATDTYYLKYTFPNVNYWLVECNYVDEVLYEQINTGELSGSLKDRLLRSHMSLRRLKDTLAANNLHDARKIVLVHMSNSRAQERRMVREINEQTGVDTVAADGGMMIDLDLIPF